MTALVFPKEGDVVILKCSDKRSQHLITDIKIKGSLLAVLIKPPCLHGASIFWVGPLIEEIIPRRQ